MPRREKHISSKFLTKTSLTGVACASVGSIDWKGNDMSQVYFYVAPSSDGWQVKSRGFTWDYDTQQLALDFAVSMAKNYSEATGSLTCIRLQNDDGDGFRLQASFGGDAASPRASTH
jgi:hypothetical protein